MRFIHTADLHIEVEPLRNERYGVRDGVNFTLQPEAE